MIDAEDAPEPAIMASVDGASEIGSADDLADQTAETPIDESVNEEAVDPSQPMAVEPLEPPESTDTTAPSSPSDPSDPASPMMPDAPTVIGDADGPATIDADDIQAMLMGLDGDWGSKPVDLSGGKGEKLQVMVMELRECVSQIGPALADAADPAGRDDAAAQLGDMQQTVNRLNEPYQFKTLASAAQLLEIAGQGVLTVPDALFDEFEVRLRGIAD